MKIHIPHVSGVSIGSINQALESYLRKQDFDISHDRLKGDILIQHYSIKKRSYTKFDKFVLIQPIDGTIITKENIDNINEYDVVITPSESGKRILSENGVTQSIFVIPNYVDENILEEDNGFFDSVFHKENKYTFYVEAIDINRKNLFNTIKYFLEQFSGTKHKDKVRLLVKTANSTNIKNYEDLKKNFVNTPEVCFINEFLNESSMHSLMKNIDCYVCLSYMEGFCIPLLNATFLKKDIITLDTKISGYSDFINNRNAYLIPTKQIPIDASQDLLIYSKDSKWEEPDYKAYQKSLLNVYLGKYEFDKTIDFSEYHHETVVKKYLEIIKNLTRENLIVGNITVDKYTQKELKIKRTKISSPKKILYVSSYGTSGYAEAGKDYILALYSLGHNVNWLPYYFCDTNEISGERDKILESLIVNENNIKWKEYETVIVHLTPDHLHDWKHNKLAKIKSNAKLISYSVWETDKLHHSWNEFLNLSDLCVVPCNLNKKVYQESGVTKPINILPHIFNRREDIKGSIASINKEDFIFYTIGQWTKRKGIDDLITVYLNEFNIHDKVVLVVKTFGSSYQESEKQICYNRINNIVRRYKNPAKIVLLLDEITQDEMTALHSTCDCYVSLCKSEGWGLGAFDAAGFGNPVIITGYGGQTDFLQPSTNYFIDYSMIKVTGMDWIEWYEDGQKWGNPDINHAQRLMREIFDSKLSNYDHESQKSFIVNNFGFDVIKKKLSEIIKE